MRVLLGFLLAGVLIVAFLQWMLVFDRQQSGYRTLQASGEEEMEQRLREHVAVLAAEIGERNLRRPVKLEAAARYIENTWKEQGYRTDPQEYTVKNAKVRNVEIEIAGKKPEEIVVIGAHYDSAPGTPGANDNASGVAALLELSRFFAGEKPVKTIRMVAFVNEEPPFYYTRHMGSRAYARRAHQRGENIVAMLSLETIGYYDDAKGSQHYPFPFSLFYPDTANFIGFVGNLGSRRLVKEALHAFRRNSSFPSRGLAAPGLLTGIGWSDHWSFWQEGYAAIMVTDTALFRYAYYHTDKDTTDRLDYPRMTRVVEGLLGCIRELAGMKNSGRKNSDSVKSGGS
jgi:hypothetical protein